MQEGAVARNVKPALNLSLKQISRALLLKAKTLTRLFSSERAVQIFECIPKPYESPGTRKLTLEQARLLALGHPAESEEDKEFMRVLFPDQSIPN